MTEEARIYNGERQSVQQIRKPSVKE